MASRTSRELPRHPRSEYHEPDRSMVPSAQWLVLDGDPCSVLLRVTGPPTSADLFVVGNRGAGAIQERFSATPDLSWPSRQQRRSPLYRPRPHARRGSTQGPNLDHSSSFRRDDPASLVGLTESITAPRVQCGREASPCLGSSLDVTPCRIASGSGAGTHLAMGTRRVGA